MDPLNASDFWSPAGEQATEAGEDNQEAAGYQNRLAALSRARAGVYTGESVKAEGAMASGIAKATNTAAQGGAPQDQGSSLYGGGPRVIGQAMAATQSGDTSAAEGLADAQQKEQQGNTEALESLGYKRAERGDAALARGTPTIAQPPTAPLGRVMPRVVNTPPGSSTVVRGGMSTPPAASPGREASAPVRGGAPLASGATQPSPSPGGRVMPRVVRSSGGGSPAAAPVGTPAQRDYKERLAQARATGQPYRLDSIGEDGRRIIGGGVQVNPMPTHPLPVA